MCLAAGADRARLLLSPRRGAISGPAPAIHPTIGWAGDAIAFEDCTLRKVSRKSRSLAGVGAACFMATAGLPGGVVAALDFNVAAAGWPNDAHRQAAVDAIQSSINRYNAYGDFGGHNVHVYYNAGIPTAQANYLGSIGFGGTYPNERVMMHELAHYLGSGTYGDPWDGVRGEALIDQFDGLEASLNGDSAHFWPYGLNYDDEGSEINKQRAVAMVYAQRADMGIGSTAIAGASGVINLTASDPLGESGFNYASRWSDTHFAHRGASYVTGNFTFRTPASGNSFTFAGDSLTVNNTNGINGGLLYKGSGGTGVTTFNNLILSGGYVRHASGGGDTFRLAGNVTLTSSATIDAAQGPITVSARIGGSGSLIKTGGYPLVLSGGSTHGGNTTISAGMLRLAPASAIADYTFDAVSGASVINSGTGGAIMNGTLANGAAIVAGGRFGNAVSLANGASVDINNGIADLGNNASWTVSAWVKTATAGASILTKGDGAGWSSGNTIFYLGDGTAGGSGGIPSAVRWGGGFFQGSTGAAVVNDGSWHHVAYVNSHGEWSIFVDGLPQPLSSGNGGFATADVGSVVRLGVSTNTVPADGSIHYNGLLDSVQFHRQALSPEQVAALFQGRSAGPLPTTTNVSIASSATLDVNGVTQQVATLSGPVGASVSLGAGELIISSPSGNTQFAGTISGAGGALTKRGGSTVTLSGVNSYTGATSVTGGTLVLANSLTTTSAVKVTDATLQLASNGSASRLIKTGSVSINGTGKLDLADNKLVVTTSGQRGTWTGTSYDGISGLVDAARGDAGNAQWNGAMGITTTDSRAINSGDLLSIGVATLGEVRNIADTATATFAGQTLLGSDTIAMVTWGGDATLDGRVNIDDYGRIDANVGQSGSVFGWANGDFNYDGKINIDDYGIIDGNIGRQTGMFLTGAVAEALSAGRAMEGIAVIPEPGGIGLLALGGVLRRTRARCRTPRAGSIRTRACCSSTSSEPTGPSGRKRL